MQAESGYVLNLAQIFTLFFVMLGPERLLTRFTVMTKDISSSERWELSIKSVSFTIIALLVAALLGRQLLHEWHIEMETLSLTAGIIFFLTALIPFLTKKGEVDGEVDGEVAPQNLTPSKIAFNILMTPYGIAAIIVLVSMSHSNERTMEILLMLLGVMILDILAMGFGKNIVKFVGITPLMILGACLKVMVLALSLQIIIASLRWLIN